MHLSMLNNRSPEQRKNIENKLFSSQHDTLDKLIDFTEEKGSLIGGESMDKKKIIQIVNESTGLRIIFNKGNTMVIEVSDPEGIRDIGCNSLWCFTYNSKHGGLNWHDWQHNTVNDFCYVIIDFSEPSDSPDFMHVLTKPLMYTYPDDNYESQILYDMNNDYIEAPNVVVNHYLDFDYAKKLMNFGIKLPKEKKKKVPYRDPNQLEFQFESKLFIKKLLREYLNISK